MAITQLPVCPRTTVFRKICSILKQDQVLSSVIKPGSFRTWSGASHDSIEFSVSMAPAVRLTPTTGPENAKFPYGRVGKLYIQAEMLLAGTDIDDVLNLWWAMEQALYPPSNPGAFITVLQAAGAYSGLPLFSQPAYDESPADRFFAAIGQIQIDVLLNLTG